MKKSFYLSALLSLLLLIGLAQAQAEVDTVTVFYSPFNTYTWIDIGIAEGYFAEQNIEIEKVTSPQPSEMILTFLQGEIDVFPAAVSPAVLNAMLRSGEVMIVGSSGYTSAESCNVSSFFIAADQADVITSPADLAGMTIASSDGLPMYMLAVMLESAGLTLDDVTVSFMPPPARPEAVLNGAAAMMFTGEPWTTRARQDENFVEFARMTDFEAITQYGALLYGPSFLGNEDLAQRFAVAALQSQRQFNEGATERNIEIVSVATELEPAFLQEMCWISMHEDGMINLESTQAYADFAFENALIDEAITVEDYVDTSFMEYANEALGPVELPEATETSGD
jgi:NitT/TauT family transport system substrate-binding protein